MKKIPVGSTVALKPAKTAAGRFYAAMCGKGIVTDVIDDGKRVIVKWQGGSVEDWSVERLRLA